MAELVNLRTVRKRVTRRYAASRADANRLAHAQPARLRKLAADRQAKAGRDLEQHRIERGDGR